MINPPNISLSGPATPPDYVDDEIDLREMFLTLIEARWLIFFVTLLAILLGATYVFLATPIYRGDALLQVESKSSGMAGLEEISTLFTGETPAEAEIEIIRSRSIIGSAVDALHLDIRAEPKYMPLIGAALARRHYSGESLAEPMFGLRQFAWGGERILVQRLNVPAQLENVELVLTARADNGFDLYDPDHQLLVSGVVGEKAARGDIKIFVAQLEAHPGTDFVVTKKPRTRTISELQEELRVSEKGKKTGVIQLMLEGPHADIIVATLNKIASLYFEQNVDRRSEEAAKTLEFLQAQLPQIKGNLEAAEARLNSYQSARGSIDLPLETQAVLQKLAELEKGLSDIELKRKELSQKFTENHPTLVTLKDQQAQFENERSALDGQIKAMPQEVQESVRLTRDVKVANEIYLLLLQRAQEMNVIKAGTIGNVRILDMALVGDNAVKPKSALVLALSLVLGLMLGAVIAFLRKILNRGVVDPDVVEQRTGLPVYASIPHSERQAHLNKKTRKQEKFGHLLALDEGKDLAVESIRSLRTSLQFALMDAKNNVVAVSGPSPGVGKSFVTANLAYLLADAGKRILLIDGDLRKGHLHDYFGLQRGKGLSGAISGEVPIEEAIHITDIERLSFVPCGVVPPNPAELLMSERFISLLEQFSKRFDLVLIDTPPVLAVTDSSIIGRLAGINFIVARYGVHPMRELEETIKRFRRSGVKPQGFIFNDIPKTARAYGYGKYAGYGYEYR